MSTEIKRRRGTTAQHASFTGAVGELTVDTTKDVVVVHDGSTVGGWPMAHGLDFSTRSDFTTAVSGKTYPIGTEARAAGFRYSYQGGSSGVTGATAWHPVGNVHPDHFVANTTPGTTDMSAALQSAWDYTGDVHLSGVAYRIDSTVRIRTSNKSLTGVPGSSLDIYTTGTDAGIWIASNFPGLNQTRPGWIDFTNLIIRRMDDTPGAPSLRLTEANKVKFDNIQFQNGQPNVLMEAATGINFVNCNAVTNIARAADYTAAFIQTHWTWDDLSVHRGYSILYDRCLFNSYNSYDQSLCYDQTVLITCSDVTVFNNTYLGASLIGLKLAPLEPTLGIGGVRLIATHIDDGGSTWWGQNGGLVMDNTGVANTVINRVNIEGSRFTGKLIPIEIISAATGRVEGINMTGGYAGYCASSIAKVRGNAATAGETALTFTGVQIDRPCMSFAHSAFDVEHVSALAVTGGSVDMDDSDAGAYFARCNTAASARLVIGSGVAFNAIPGLIEPATASNWSKIIMDDGCSFTGAGETNETAKRAWVPYHHTPWGAATLTDLTAEIAPGPYSFSEATATGSPGSSAYTHHMLATEASRTGGQSFLTWRATSNTANSKMWLGVRTTRTGAITWTPLLLTTTGADALVVGTASDTAPVTLNTMSIHGQQLTIADDAVGTITPARAGGFWALTCAGSSGSASPLDAFSARGWFDTGSSLNILKDTGLAIGGTVDVVTTDVAGTTGTDGRVTVAVQSGVIKIENRSGASRSFQLMVF